MPQHILSPFAQNLTFYLFRLVNVPSGLSVMSLRCRQALRARESALLPTSIDNRLRKSIISCRENLSGSMVRRFFGPKLRVLLLSSAALSLAIRSPKTNHNECIWALSDQVIKSMSLRFHTFLFRTQKTYAFFCAMMTAR